MIPPAPTASFASDNFAPAHPSVIEAVARVNAGPAVAYGDDPWTHSVEQRLRDLFGGDVVTMLTFNGTGANVLALGALLGPVEAVVSTAQAHIAVDEAGAPERILGAKIIDIPTDDAKLMPAHLDELGHLHGVEHHVQPGVVSITQSTELGTVYSSDEIGALCDAARSRGMRVHMDGARIGNAVAAAGGGVATLRAMTIDAGVDVITFGGTKAGGMGAEAVVFLNPEHARVAKYVRKQVNQLASKMRYLAAQFLALTEDDLWLSLAGHANAMTARLYEATSAIPGVVHRGVPEVNSLFPTLPPAAIHPLREWSLFWPWDPAKNQVRWMTAWDTTEEDVDHFAAGVRHFLASPPS